MKTLSALAAMLAAGMAMPATAATIVHVSSVSAPTGYKSGTIHNDGGIGGVSSLKDLSVEVTDFDFHIDSPGATDIFTYCIDTGDFLYSPANFTVTTAAAVGLTTTQSNAILSLLTNTLANPSKATLDQGTNTAKAAGIQLAIWEIMDETSTGWNIGKGSFYATANSGSLGSVSVSTDPMGLAAAYLSNVAVGGQWYNKPLGNYQLAVLSGQADSPKDQNQVFLVAVPEPAAWGMMILGSGLIGASLRRRRAPVRAIAA